MLKEAREFLESIPPKVALKFDNAIGRVLAGETDVKIFKKLKKRDFYEFRVFSFPNQYRLFAFWDEDEDSLIVATHGIVKKDQELRNSEFKLMEKIRKDYIQRKKNR